MIMTFNEMLNETKDLHNIQENDYAIYILCTGAWVACALLGKTKLAILSGLVMAFAAGHRAVISSRINENLELMVMRYYAARKEVKD